MSNAFRDWACLRLYSWVCLSPVRQRASPEGKRVMLLGTANTNPYIGAWTSTFMQVGHAGRHEGDESQLEL